MATADRGAQARFGTFGGVFTPCTLTILGVIMFMRSGYVVGEAGVLGALLILAMAKAITGLTTISLSAISTNTDVRTGGVYYMISRTLGADFGGAIGLTLFVSQAIAIAFYVIGFSEALFALFPAETAANLRAYGLERLLSTLVILVLFAVTFKGADLAIRAQYPILVALLIAVASFIVGGLAGFDASTFSDNLGSPEGGAGLWILFAIFFPAATGITAGANMSGDLKDPGHSIPRGTFIAIAFTAGIYAVQLLLLGGYAGSEQLSTDSFGSLEAMSVFSPLVVLGVWAATLSSALGSFLGAPRILQAMGKDNFIPRIGYFGVGHGPADEPRRATVLSLMIAVAIVWMGGLDAVAQVISMFFLIAYGMINLSAFVEGSSGNPSFRPRFKRFGWPASLAGAIGCAVAMLKINTTYAIIAMIIAAAIYFWLRARTQGQADWEDARRGFIFARTRTNLLLLEKSKPDPKNWRPALAVITDDVARDRLMLTCASWLESKRGILSVLELTGTEERGTSQRLAIRGERLDAVKAMLGEREILAFADSVVVTGNPAEHMATIVQSYSIGALRPNAVMLSIPGPSQPERRRLLSDLLREIEPFNLNIILYKKGQASRFAQIDVWWHGQRNGSLMTLLAYLTATSPDWKGARIRMLRIPQVGEDRDEAERSLTELMTAARMPADIEVILSDRPVADLIAEYSASADLVFLGMAARDLGDFERVLEQRDPLLKRLPPTLLVLSNGDVDLLA